ncbi:MAG: hypothetical protein ACXW5H_29815 [Thermoanaerobaculia bacterium]
MQEFLASMPGVSGIDATISGIDARRLQDRSQNFRDRCPVFSASMPGAMGPLPQFPASMPQRQVLQGHAVLRRFGCVVTAALQGFGMGFTFFFAFPVMVGALYTLLKR